jgi:hypothetical protein
MFFSQNRVFKKWGRLPAPEDLPAIGPVEEMPGLFQFQANRDFVDFASPC